MKIWLAGGGTGGHLCPGLALADELKILDKSLELGFLGTNEGLDREILWGSGYPLKILAAGRGSPFSWRRPLNFPKFFYAFFQCVKLFLQERPAAIIALGGFAAATPGLAARFLNIPVFILEQNTIPGRVNRLLSGWAKQIYSQFQDAEQYFKKSSAKFFHTGSPLRAPFKALAYEAPCYGDCLLVMGGSQGARGLNNIVVESARRFVGETGCKIIHVAGPAHEQIVRDAYNLAGVEAEVYGFYNNMSELYKRSRLVIARSGAISIAELSAAGLPAIFIPLPSSMDNHQRKNAQVMSNLCAAISYEETTASIDTFAPLVVSLWNNSDKLLEMSKAMREDSLPEAGKNIAELILSYLGDK